MKILALNDERTGHKMASLGNLQKSQQGIKYIDNFLGQRNVLQFEM